MTKRVASLLMACLMLTATGCAYAAAKAQPDGTPYKLYFQRADLASAAGGDAIMPETVYLTETEGMTTTELARRLLDSLLEGPQDAAMKSPIPTGTSLQTLSVEGSRVQVDLSSAYGSLSGVALTMADYCITLTLTQLKDIYTVGITVRGRELAYRDSQSFTARDVLLSSAEDVVGTLDVTLYFLNKTGKLTPEERTLELYEGDTQLDAVLEALQSGPKSSTLKSSLPEKFQVRSLWQEDNICYVNLPSSALPDLTDADLQTAIESLAESMGSLPQVSEVQFLMDGEFAHAYGSVSIADPFPVG